MELRDLIATPLIIIFVYLVAYWVRPYSTDSISRVYFIPALTVKIIGAISLGLIYTYYYNGGDTFKYHTYGSRPIWNAIMESPLDGFSLLFSGPSMEGSLYKYTSQIAIHRDTESFFVARIATVFDLFTFSSYSATAVLFAVLSFVGMWHFFLTFYESYPHLHRRIAVAAFFIPSVIFWGSGILKDTITLACLGLVTYSVKKIFIDQKFTIGQTVILFLSLFVIYSIKKYILLCFLPALILWVFVRNLSSIRSLVLRIMLVPFIMVMVVASGYFAIIKVGEGDRKYDINQIAATAKITAYDIRFQTGREAGSGYNLGELDGTMGSLVRLLPQAINVSLFRPYLWEANNPLMLLSAFESLIFLLLTIYVIIRCRTKIFLAFTDPDVLFCLIFSLSFAFAVGVSTFNFGTLTRYKIPLLPFYLVTLILMLNYSNKERKLTELEETE